MHASYEAEEEEESYDTEKDVEECLAYAVGVEDEESQDGGCNAIEEVVNVVAGKVDVDRFGVFKGIADEPDDAVADIIDGNGSKEDEDVLQDVGPVVGYLWEEGVEAHEGDGYKHEGCYDGLVYVVGKVGVAQHTIHGSVVDGGVEQVKKLNLFIAQKDAYECDGEDNDYK